MTTTSSYEEDMPNHHRRASAFAARTLIPPATAPSRKLTGGNGTGAKGTTDEDGVQRRADRTREAAKAAPFTCWLHPHLGAKQRSRRIEDRR